VNRRNAFQFKAGNSIFHRLDPMSKLVWLFGVSLLAFGAYIAWIQIVITVAVLGTALFLARLSVLEVVRGTWIFIAASVSFFINPVGVAAGTHGCVPHLLQADLCRERGLCARLGFAHLCNRAVFDGVRAHDRSARPRDRARHTDAHAVSHRLHVLHRPPHRADDRGGNSDHPSAHAVRGVARQRSIAGRIGETKRYVMPLLVGSLRRASTMVMSMEARAFGAYPTRTFVESPRMSAFGVSLCVFMGVAVVVWYSALMLGYVHSVYIFFAGVIFAPPSVKLDISGPATRGGRTSRRAPALAHSLQREVRTPWSKELQP